MIHSMTGYGQAEGEVGGADYAVEIRAVNNRYLKTSIRLPETAAFLEDEIDKMLRKSLSRGTVNYILHIKNAPANTLFCINEAALRSYMEKLNKAVASVDMKSQISVGGLLTLPGVIQPALPDEEQAEQIEGLVLKITGEALDKLKQMRIEEGSAIAADLDGHCKAIKQSLEQIQARSGTVPAEYVKKLRKRIEELTADAKLKLDEQTLAREIAVFAERSDISEEITRLNSHLQQFAESCHTDGQAGRRLDFISQEMLREANTIASKASDAEISHHVVDIKCRIDRIKEQVQNVV